MRPVSSRNILAIPLLPVLLVGCATAPISLTTSAPLPVGDLYTCAMQQLARMDYTVDNTDRESGFIQARKQTSGAGTDFFFGQAYHNAMTVTIFDQAVGEQTTFRVTVGQITEDTWGWGQGTERLGRPSPDAAAEAEQLVAACAPRAGLTATFESVPSGRVGEWVVSDDVAAGGARTVQLALYTADRSPPGDPVVLVLRCEQGRMDLYLHWATQLALYPRVTTRVDAEPALSSRWLLSTDMETTTFPGNAGEFILSKLMNADSLAVEVTPNSETAITAAFDVSGLDRRILPLLEACPF